MRRFCIPFLMQVGKTCIEKMEQMEEELKTRDLVFGKMVASKEACKRLRLKERRLLL
jgi:hypothetical protein